MYATRMRDRVDWILLAKKQKQSDAYFETWLHSSQIKGKIRILLPECCSHKLVFQIETPQFGPQGDWLCAHNARCVIKSSFMGYPRIRILYAIDKAEKEGLKHIFFRLMTDQ